jgi:hypothetical protein
MEKAMKEFTRRKTKSTRGRRYLCGVGGGSDFILCWPLLEYGTGGEKVVLDELEDLALIDGRGLQLVWVGCDHVEEDQRR